MLYSNRENTREGRMGGRRNKTTVFRIFRMEWGRKIGEQPEGGGRGHLSVRVRHSRGKILDRVGGEKERQSRGVSGEVKKAALERRIGGGEKSTGSRSLFIIGERKDPEMISLFFGEKSREGPEKGRAKPAGCGGSLKNAAKRGQQKRTFFLYRGRGERKKPRQKKNSRRAERRGGNGEAPNP